MNLKEEVDDFDISLMCKKFPSITLGSAPQLDLYDETASYSEATIISAMKDFEHHFSDSSEVMEVQNTLSEAQPSLSIDLSSVTNFTLRKDDSLIPQSVSSIYEEKLDQVTREDSQKKVGLQSQSNVTLNELSLDKSVNYIPGVTKKQYEQLDNCGFHTLRKLLHHFPRANLQNAHSKIDDGQHLIFVEVLSSRGVKASCSFSFIEVIIGCQIVDRESAIEHVTVNVEQKKTIYLHLKKYFRGTRFTSKPFLNSIANKYHLGDIACVSGKLGRLFQMLDGLGTQIEKDGLLDKYRRLEDNSVCNEEWSCLTKKVLELLPYTLTPGQLQAISEIIWDLKRPVSMNRLL